MNQIIKNLGTRLASWLAENTAPTYLDRGFFNVDEEALFMERTQWILRECDNAYKQVHLNVMEAYYKRYLAADNFKFISKFIADKNNEVIKSIAARREFLTSSNQALIIKLNEAIAQN